MKQQQEQKHRLGLPMLAAYSTADPETERWVQILTDVTPGSFQSNHNADRFGDRLPSHSPALKELGSLAL